MTGGRLGSGVGGAVVVGAGVVDALVEGVDVLVDGDVVGGTDGAGVAVGAGVDVAAGVAAGDEAGPVVAGALDGLTTLGAGVGSNIAVHVYVGREALTKYAVPSRRTPTRPAIHRIRMRFRWRNEPPPAPGRRERRVARLAELGRRGGVVKVSLVRLGTGSAWKSARSARGA